MYNPTDSSNDQYCLLRFHINSIVFKNAKFFERNFIETNKFAETNDIKISTVPQ